VVRLASQAGVELLSLTDHDSVDGVPEAAEAASALGLRLVPGVEISALDAGQGDLHILGYLIDERDHTLRERLETFRGARERRAEAMAEAIRQVGFELDDRTLRERAREGKSIGRPHLAEAAVGHPANADRLAREGRLDPTAFLVAYLIEGAPAFRPREAPSVEQAIRAIHEAGGVAIWAHPFWDLSAPPEVLATIDRFRALGLDGVECFYATHTPEQIDAALREPARTVSYVAIGPAAAALNVGDEVFPISALKGTGVEELTAHLAGLVPEGAFLYPPEDKSDLPQRVQLAELVREQVLLRTREEVPHAVEVELDELEENEDGMLVLVARVWAESESQKGILIGSGGKMIKAIGSAARPQIEGVLGRGVHLDLSVRVRKGWRRDEGLLDRLGIE